MPPGPESALIIIDLQNDFLAPDASFPVDLQAQQALRVTLETLVPSFRQSGGLIVWIKSHYALATKEWKEFVNQETATETLTGEKESVGSEQKDVYVQLKWVIEGTHIGKRPCCQEGSPAAEFVPWAEALVDPSDSTVIKTYYSAFKKSDLQTTLEERDIKTIYLAGLLSNMCVLATALYAIRLVKDFDKEWRVYTVVDALAWRNEKSHLKALETMERQGAHLITSEKVISAGVTT